MRKRRKRQRLLTEIASLNIVLDTFNLVPKERANLQRRRLKRIQELARLEQVEERLKPSVARKPC